MLAEDPPSHRARRAALVFALLLTLMSLIQSDHRAKKGRNALLKWAPAQEAADRGEEIYGGGSFSDVTSTVSAEGYPTLPVTLVVMRPFHLAGPRLGPLLWAGCKLGLAWWMVLAALGLAFGSARRAPPWVLWLVLLGSFRVLHSDVQHGNLNLVVGAVVMAGIVSIARGRSFWAGLAFGLGATLKVTPALGLAWLVARGSGRGVLGFAAGLAAGIIAPMGWLGVGRSLSMARAWVEQMLVPYLSGRELTLMQTEHINQSLFGVLSRHLTSAVAIPARSRGPAEPLRIGWLDLDLSAFQLVHLSACLIVLGIFLFVAFRMRHAGPAKTLGTGALLGLAMVMLSERSWKHHHILLPLALVFLCWAATQAPTQRLAWWLLAAAAITFAGTGDLFLGSWGSDLAEAYGAYALGDIVLFLGLARLLTGP